MLRCKLFNLFIGPWLLKGELITRKGHDDLHPPNYTSSQAIDPSTPRTTNRPLNSSNNQPNPQFLKQPTDPSFHAPILFLHIFHATRQTLYSLPLSDLISTPRSSPAPRFQTGWRNQPHFYQYPELSAGESWQPRLEETRNSLPLFFFLLFFFVVVRMRSSGIQQPRPNTHTKRGTQINICQLHGHGRHICRLCLSTAEHTGSPWRESGWSTLVPYTLPHPSIPYHPLYPIPPSCSGSSCHVRLFLPRGGWKMERERERRREREDATCAVQLNNVCFFLSFL